MILTPPAAAQVIVPDALFVVTQWLEGTSLFCGVQKECSGSIKDTSSGSRAMARFGLPYTYKGRPLPSTPFSQAPCLDFLRVLIQDFLGCSFNAAVVNRYSTGEHYLPHHSDTHAIPQLGQDPVIAGISWGATRAFEFKGKKKNDVALVHHQAPGDLVVMHGISQRFYTHGIPVSHLCSLPRWSVTFRFHQ
jgi:hypothetical protein